MTSPDGAAATDRPPAAGDRAAAPAAAADRVPRGVKLGYAAGDFGAGALVTITGFFLTPFLLDVVGLRPAIIGLILLASQVWDGVTDPVVGVLSDRTSNRWGRKRGWLLYAAVPLGATYAATWVVPEVSTAGLVVYYLAVTLLLRTFFTAAGVPHGALTPELTADYDERTRINTYRFTLSLLGSLVAIASHPVLLDLAGTDVRAGNAISGVVWGVVIAAGFLIAFRATAGREARAPGRASRPAIRREVLAVLRNRPFQLVTTVYLCAWFALLLVQNNLLLFVRYWADGEDLFTVILLAFQVTAIVFLPIWSAVSARIGKRRVYALGAGLWILGLLAMIAVPRGTAAPYIAIAALIGAGAAVAYLIPWSMLPDVVDDDELATGVRREGVFYGLFVFLQKVGLSLGLALSGFALEIAGYVNPGEAGSVVDQPDAVLTALRVLVTVVPAAVLALSVPVALRYPIDRARQERTRALLVARHEPIPD